MENACKLVTNERNYLVSEPNYHTTKYFSENLLAIEMKKNKSKNKHTSICRFINSRN